MKIRSTLLALFIGTMTQISLAEENKTPEATATKAEGQTEVISQSTSKTYSQWRQEEKNGLGFGLSAAGLLDFNLFYDRNIGDRFQLHIQFDSGSVEAETSDEVAVVRGERQTFHVTYRWFFNEQDGFYLGGGLGVMSGKFRFKYDPSQNFETEFFTSFYSSITGDTSLSQSYEYTESLNGVYAIGEIGWQGNDNYYFHVGIQPGFYLSLNDDYDSDEILPLSNYRSRSNEVHDLLVLASKLSIGFGWFF